MIHLEIPPALGIVVSIVLMASTIVFAARVVLTRSSQPWPQALLIAAVSNTMGKYLVSEARMTPAVSYGVPTLAFFVLSFYFFRPSVGEMLRYWLVGFAAYLAL
ncbi:MAG: hypothetical protein U0164_24815, partial [Gemmatimonadaceae bacterium]